MCVLAVIRPSPGAAITVVALLPLILITGCESTDRRPAPIPLIVPRPETLKAPQWRSTPIELTLNKWSDTVVQYVHRATYLSIINRLLVLILKVRQSESSTTWKENDTVGFGGSFFT
jgi:hypothetical protein